MMHNVSELVVGCGVWCMSLRVGGNGFVEQPVSAGCQHHIAARCRGARRAESQDAPPSEPLKEVRGASDWQEEVEP
jgi:hypothetical protein